jgi:Domain of Unknown Function (DUF1080)
MHRPQFHRPRIAAALLMALCAQASLARAQNAAEGWIELIGPSGSLDAWKSPATNWENVRGVHLNPSNLKGLAASHGKGVIYNGPKGRAVNLYTKESFGDVELHLEFLVPKGSNSGVKLEGVYEIQIYDSYGVKKATASHTGGVYPRAELLPSYHHIDDGYPPKTNAARPPGEWQTLDITYLSPKFDAEGKKTANAKFVKVLLNGQVVQEDLGIPCPTGNNWRMKEQSNGPIMLQGDHGSVAFRNMRVRPLNGK